MGGSSGGSISTIDLTKITSAANARIQEAFSRERSVLFVCSPEEAGLLIDMISKTTALKGVQFEVISEIEHVTEEKISEFNIVVTFVRASTKHEAINSAIQIATTQKKTCLFVRSDESSPIPQYVLQYRIRCLNWQEFSDFVRA